MISSEDISIAVKVLSSIPIGDKIILPFIKIIRISYEDFKVVVEIEDEKIEDDNPIFN